VSDEFRKNLMGPEPTLLPAESEIYQHLALGQEAVDLVASHGRAAQPNRTAASS